MEPYEYPAHHLHKLLKKGEVSSQEITESVFDRIEPVSYTHLTLPTTPYV